MGSVDKLWKNYVGGDMEYFYKEIQKFTRTELREVSDNMQGLSIVLNRYLKDWDAVINYPAENEE